ncbi:Rha family transcriptional regulator [Enterococcus faecium]|uniref:Rha family transcriptional regulator n=1 Tax=Enterococcus faecium TaxID=1352 RepID=UPI001924BDD5|nr:Rha family transcriptional regulator [Enterococcus faecium]MBL3707525.1 Rha family transcriptional regulator [Enterococcus faecium]
MNQLQQTLTSNEVAEMMGTTNGELMKTIRTYINYLAEGEIPTGDFFIESTYKDSNNQERPNYLLTKQGCEMVSNKLTGPKGVQFTAKYVSRFNQMEEHIKQQIDTSKLSPELQMFQRIFNAVAKQELETKRLATQMDNITEIVALNTTDWRRDCRNFVNKMAQTQGGYGAYQEIQTAIYEEVDRRAGSSLKTRLTNLRNRMAGEGVPKSKRDKTNKLDVIESDKRLKEIYLSVVKDFAIKYGVWKEK